jgi:outer membrane protein assembly factor BamB
MRLKIFSLLFTVFLGAALVALSDAQAPDRRPAASSSPVADWPELRGPGRDGLSPEKNLPEKWSPRGENLLWRAPYGGISGPVVLGDRVYLQNTVGNGATLQERVLCLDANSGKVLWEQRINLYHSDVPPHRAAWATPALDPETGNVYVFAVKGTLAAFTRDGKPLWTRYLTEEFGLITTHGGRTVSPLVDSGLVIVSGITFNYGELAGGGHRFLAFDKQTGECVWFSSPGGRPYDTTYAPPIVAVVNGVRLLIAGASDGHFHALKVATGEPVWKYEVSKRGLNTGVVFAGGHAILTHSEENLETNEMGFRAALDPALTGTLTNKHTKWLHYGFLGGFSSPVTDGKTIYQVDNGALLGAFDAESGRLLWTRKLGTIQKANAVLADGKLYVGTENGKFFILRSGPQGAEVLSEVELGNPEHPEEITSGAAVSRGRIYFASTQALYAIGRKGSRVPPWRPPAPQPSGEVGTHLPVPAYVQVIPAEVMLSPGETVKFRVRLFDAKGNAIRSFSESPAWTLEQLAGSIQPDGTFAASKQSRGEAGKVKATVGNVSGFARVRVIPPLPWNEDFSGYAPGQLPSWWMNARIKFAVKELEGNRVLTKLADNQFSFIKRARAYAGRHDWSDHTIECDVRFAVRRRTLGDGGVVAQGYSLVLFPNHERVELLSWQPETARTVSAPFSVKPDTWYRLKLRVENLPDGRVRARGKVWLAGEPEPDAWLLERTDPPGLGIRHGSPGLYGDAPAEVYFDHLKVYPNK